MPNKRQLRPSVYCAHTVAGTALHTVQLVLALVPGHTAVPPPVLAPPVQPVQLAIEPSAASAGHTPAGA
jgi:hypothetical protein